MKSRLEKIERRLTPLVPKLLDVIDRSWLVSTYLSLKKAYALNYKEDTFSRLPKDKQDTIVLGIKSLGSSKAGDKEWESGYYFNNAMFRMVALTEIALKVLFERKVKMKPPPSYPWLSKWYETSYGNRLSNVNSARSRVNKFKHEPRSRATKKKFESMQEGVDAFEELLLLLEQV
jgi:hypothetical protein